ncbi:hypothetical protein M0805_003649 [Coniferiporia weirii]|nr:hypothetical protein M0805_003649 [Coniferiporia weirii]
MGGLSKLGTLFSFLFPVFASVDEDESPSVTLSSGTTPVPPVGPPLSTTVSHVYIQPCSPQRATLTLVPIISSLSIFSSIVAYLGFLRFPLIFAFFLTCFAFLKRETARLTFRVYTFFLGTPTDSVSWTATRGEIGLGNSIFKLDYDTPSVNGTQSDFEYNFSNTINMPYALPTATLMAPSHSVPSTTSTCTLEPAHTHTISSTATALVSPYGLRVGHVHSPLSLTITRSGPASVPPRTPFTPPIPSSPPLSSSSTFNAQNAASKGYLYPPPPAPPLVKSHSDSSAPTSSSSTGILQIRSESHAQSQSQVQAHAVPIRRAVSASSASSSRTPSASARAALSAAMRYANAAGRGLPHIPRRRGSSVISDPDSIGPSSPPSAEPDASTATKTQGFTSQGNGAIRVPARGRTRSRFVLGDEESGSGNSDEDADGKTKTKGGHGGGDMNVEERAVRKRPVSADRTRALGMTPSVPAASATLISASIVADHVNSVSVDDSSASRGDEIQNGNSDAPAVFAEHECSDSDPESECATPTPSSVARERQKWEQTIGDEDKDLLVKGSTNSSIPGIAPRARRVRGRGGRRRSGGVFGEECDDQEIHTRTAAVRNQTSTVAFPSSATLTPLIAVKSATPQATPFSSPRQNDSATTALSSKRKNAGALHIDLGSVEATPGDVEEGEWHEGGVDSERHASRAQHNPPYPSENGALDTTAILDPDDETSAPAMRTLSESTSLINIPLIRKKSGEVLKPSLKSRSPSAAAGSRHRPSHSLPDIAGLALLSPSVSAPATPRSAAKMVHFDAKLEHVRLFLAEQKPVAVSRDGSPTPDDTTSGGENDSGSDMQISSMSISAFLARPRPRRLVPDGGASDEEAAVRRVLMMRVLNMPIRSLTEVGFGAGGVDVLLEGLYLADDSASVQGTVRVKNIAFEKNIAVRFTFDGWQTTSEVLARWAESCPSPAVGMMPSADQGPAQMSFCGSAVDGAKVEASPPSYDRFIFSIRLADILLRIDEKTLVLAVRYRVAGREIWDNNGGQNYRAVFERRTQTALTFAGSAVVAPGSDAGRETQDEAKRGPRTGFDSGSSLGQDGRSGSGSDGAKPNGAGIGTILHNALDNVITERNAMSAKNGDTDPSPSTRKPADPLASRYNIGESLKKSAAWRPQLEHAFTFAGHELNHDGTLKRGALPGREKKRTSSFSMASSGSYSNARSFESHPVSFNAQELTRGSPRDNSFTDGTDVDRFASARFNLAALRHEVDGVPFAVRGARGSPEDLPIMTEIGSNGQPHGRNHQRSYFDMRSPTRSVASFGGNARMTPPRSPGSSYRSLSDSDADGAMSPSQRIGTSSIGSPTRHHSFPPLGPVTASASNSIADTGLSLSINTLQSRRNAPLGVGLGIMQDAVDSEASTPSITSASSPCSPPDFSMLSPVAQAGPAFTESTSMDSSKYSILLNTLCFYTGHDAGMLDASPDLRRSQTVSSVQEILSSPSQSSMESFSYVKGPIQVHTVVSPRATTPTMPASPDELGSGARTPTSTSFLKSGYFVSTHVHG